MNLSPCLWLLMLGTFSLAGALASSGASVRVIIVGGSSGMGKGLAKVVLSRGGRVLLASRNADKLARAREECLAVIDASSNTDCAIRVQTAVLDATDEDAVQKFASELTADWNGLVVSAAGKAPHGPVTDLDSGATRDMFETKFWTAYHSIKHVAPRLEDGGSIALVAGVLNRRPGVNCAPLASVNGALEGLTRSAALDLAPRLRVNCLSPGFCDTERFDSMDRDRKEKMMANTASSLPLQRVGVPEDMGEGLYFLLTGSFVTGVVLDVDGGHHIRQYAMASTDPMRAKPAASPVQLSSS